MMNKIHWQCQMCDAEGSDNLPELCPKCECYISATLSEEGFKEGLRTYRLIQERGEKIANLLGFGCDRLEFEGETFTITWDSYHCGCSDTVSKELPIRYLWMTDSDILAEVVEIKAQELKKEQLKKIAQARAQVDAARVRAASAKDNAERELVKVVAELEALQGGTP